MDDLGLIPDQQPRTLGETLSRYAALTNKKLVPMAAATGAGAATGLLGGPFAEVTVPLGAVGGLASYGAAHLADLPVAAYNSLKPQSWPTSPYPGTGFDEAVNAGLKKLGVNYGQDVIPESAGERIFQTTANAMGDAASGNSLGTLLKGAMSPATQAVGRAFNPEVTGKTINLIPYAGSIPGAVGRAAQSVQVPASAANVAISGVSGSAAGAAQEAFPDSALAPLVAGLAVPAAAPAALNGVKTVLRGGASPAKIQKAVDLFNEVGSTPSVGQATGNTSLLRLENYLSKFPGATGIMERRAQEQTRGLADRVTQLSDAMAPMSPGANSTIAGEAAVQGIEKRFIPASRRIQTGLYDALEKGTPLETSPTGSSANYSKILQELSTPVAPGTETGGANLLQAHGDVQDLITRFNNDVAAGKGDVSYLAKKGIRTKIGEQMVKPYDSNGNKVDNATLKRIYGALTRDMEADANAAGLGDQFRKANQATVELNDKLESLYGLLNTADKSGEGSMVARVTSKGLNSPRQGVNKQLKTLTDSLPTGAYKTFAGSFLNDLATPKASAQNAAGTGFSIESLVTNWNSYSPQAKQAVFGRLAPDHVANLNKIMGVASDIRDSSRFLQNSSGTGQVVNYGMAAAALGQGVAGNTRASLGFLIPMAVGNVGARALTSPGFVRFLAKNNNVSAGNLLPQIDRLTEQARKKGDEAGVEAFGKLKESLNSGADLGAVPDHSDLGLIPDPEPTPSRAKKLLAE